MSRLDEAGLPYINLAEPEALIGFAGPRVIRETIGQDLPKDSRAPNTSNSTAS